MRNKNKLLLFSSVASAGLLLLPLTAIAQQASGPENPPITVEEQNQAFSLAAGSLSGHVFIDKNGNGEEDEDDLPAKGCTITVQGSQSNSETTDDNGDYVTQEAAGNVSVTVSLQDGDCKGGKVTTASAGGGATQSITVTGGGSAFAEPVGVQVGKATASSNNSGNADDEDEEELADTASEGFKAIALALGVLVLMGALQLMKKTAFASKIRIGGVNLLK